MSSWSVPSTEIARNRRRRTMFTAAIAAASALVLAMALFSSLGV
ncbi:MAG TPA: hypothetical protein VML96_02455 [Egibacteraceae bacterium]|nr:hypothetical protein [Egibacteraceae bacterium]